MTAVDTNIVVRLLTGDDLAQSAAARTLFASEQIWIPKTVVLETNWVLRSLYGFTESQIREALVRLLGLRNVQVEDETSVANALALTAHGVELADALHVCSRPAGSDFVSFDRAFVQRARRGGVTGVRVLMK